MVTNEKFVKDRNDPNKYADSDETKSFHYQLTFCCSIIEAYTFNFSVGALGLLRISAIVDSFGDLTVVS